MHGGHEFDGREISPLDEDEIAAALAGMVAGGCTSLAIAGVFSPATPAHELEVAGGRGRIAPDLAVTLSHQVGRLGLIERENACVLNAALATLARRVVGAYAASLARFGIDAALYVSQNDGTVASVDDAVQDPAAHLRVRARRTACAARPSSPGSPTRSCSTSAGRRRTAARSPAGFRGRRRAWCEVAGVRTTLRMPDVTSIALGGGSIVADGRRPRSVRGAWARGSTTDALVFGGRTLTFTDVAVAAGTRRRR